MTKRIKEKEKLDSCTVCSQYSLVKRYKDEWICSKCISELNRVNNKDRMTGNERIERLRKKLYGS